MSPCLFQDYMVFIPGVTQGTLSAELGDMAGSKIPLCNVGGEKLLLRPSWSYNKLLGRVEFRSSSAKIANNLNTLTIFAKKRRYGVFWVNFC